MENQQKLTERETKISKGRKGWRMAGLVIGIAAASVIGIMFADTSSSRASTPSEIAAQEEFQSKLIKSHEEFQHKMDAAAKEANQTHAAQQSKAKLIQ